MIPLLHTGFAAGMAIHVGTDPHLAPGVHFRVHPSLILGLPVAPLAVYRVAGTGGGGLIRRDVRWVDARGAERTLPFEVTPDNPVTGYLGAGLPGGAMGVRPVWAQVEATGGGRGEPLRVTALGGHGTPRPLGSRSAEPWALGGAHIRQLRVEGRGRVQEVQWFDMGWRVTRGAEGGQAKPLPLRELWRLLDLPTGSRPRYAAASGWQDRVEARIARGAPLRLGFHDEPGAATPAGLPAATHSQEAARLAAFTPPLAEHLDHLLEGPLPDSGVLRHMTRSTTIDLQPDRVEPPDPEAEPIPPGQVNLPSLGTVLSGAADPGVARWLGLMDRDEAPDPPPVPGTPLLYLVRGLWIPRFRGPEELLKALLMQQGMRPAPPHLEEWQAMGLSFPRLVDGVVPWEGWTVAVAVAHAPPDPPQPPQLGPELPPRDPPTADGLGRWLPTPEGIPAREARREVTLALGGLHPVGTLAVARVEAEHGAPRTHGLNPRIQVPGSSSRAAGWLPEEAPHQERGLDPALRWRVRDREAPGEGTAYRVAQADAFGRWSRWGEHAVADKAPPRPPAPALETTWHRPPGWEDPGEGRRWGRLQVEVPIPDPTRLAPGGWPVGSLRLRVRALSPEGTPLGSHDFGPLGLEGAPTEPEAGEDPALEALPDQGLLRIRRSAAGDPRAVVHLGPQALARVRPGLQRNEAVVLELTGWWLDTRPAPAVSEPGGPRPVEVVDPRPPPPVVMDPTLRYAARADADGISRVRLEWEGGPGQAGWAVYVSDETRIVAALEERLGGAPLVEVALDDDGRPLAEPDVADAAEQAGIRALLEALEAAPDVAHRAQLFQEAGRPALLRKPWFQRFEVAPPEAGDPAFHHALSGALRVPSFYRIVAMNSLGVEAEFGASPVVAVAVPPDGPPPTPTLTVLRPSEVEEEAGASDGGAGAAASSVPEEAWLELRVPRGAVPAAHFRLRRSGAGLSDPGRMLVVAEGPVPGPDAPGESQRLRIRDSGAAPGEPHRRLAPFTRYLWRAEVQAPSPPGSELPGVWSAASAPVSTLLLPPPPQAPPAPTAEWGADGSLRLRWQYEGPLRGGGMGGYRLQFQHEDPEGEVTLHEVALPLNPRRPAPEGHPWTPEDPPPDPRGRWRLQVVDPAGRAGPFSPPVRVT